MQESRVIASDSRRMSFDMHREHDRYELCPHENSGVQVACRALPCYRAQCSIELSGHQCMPLPLIGGGLRWLTASVSRENTVCTGAYPKIRFIVESFDNLQFLLRLVVRKFVLRLHLL